MEPYFSYLIVSDDYGDIGAEGVEDASQLHCDVATAHHHRLSGEGRGAEGEN